MAIKNNKGLDEYQALMSEVLTSSDTLSLSTLNKNKEPQVSLIPFLYHDNQFWIFVSQLSPHTQHLQYYTSCALLVYDNQTVPKNCFAIERVSANCHAKLEPDNNEHILDLMEQKLGQTMSLLRQLGDFNLFSLTPKEGRFIAGFGQAFTVNFFDGSLNHIDPSAS